MLQRSIQSVLELTSNGCYSVGSGVSWSCLLQRSIHSVLGVTWNGCYNVTLEKDIKRRRSWLSQLENDPLETLKLLRLPRKTRLGHIRPYPRVTFAPTSALSRGKCDTQWNDSCLVSNHPKTRKNHSEPYPNIWRSTAGFLFCEGKTHTRWSPIVS